MGFRPHFNTPFTRVRDALWRYVKPFYSLSPRTRLLIGFAFLVLVTTLLLTHTYWSSLAADYSEGDVVSRKVIAPSDITTVWSVETDKRREAARQATRPVFTFDSSRVVNSAESFRAAWEELKRQTTTNSGKPATWTGEGGQGVAKAIADHHFDEEEL